VSADSEVYVPRTSPGRPRRKLRPLQWVGVVVIGLAVVSLVRVLTGADNLDSSGAIEAAIVAATPIALAGLSGLWSERAGVVNIGIEGMMVLGTFGAGFAGYQWGPWAGVFFGAFCGLLGGLLHALVTVTVGVDHIISGVAINILAPGIALYLSKLLFSDAPGGGQKQSPPVPDVGRITLPFLSDWLGTVEEKGTFFIADVAGIIRGCTTNLSLLTVLAVILIAATGWVLWRTRFGLRLRSVGEAPYASESLGVNVYWYKYAAVMISGALAGLAGSFLVVGLKYQDGQTSGRGFIGLASMIFGNWRPGGMAAGAGLFGYTGGVQVYDADGSAMHALLLIIAIALAVVAFFQIRGGHMVVGGVAGTLAILSVIWFLSTERLPPELVQAAPYVVTLLVMGLASQNLRMPKADGLIYRKGGG
jgi:general nucleoside transport system permease protein